MPWFGAHMSAAGEPATALEAAAQFDMHACQLFTKSNRQWRAAPLTQAMVDNFHHKRNATQMRFAVAHAAYLLNLATADPVLHERSIVALVIELERAERLGLEYLVVHPGVASDDNLELAMDQVAKGIQLALARLPALKVQLLLETTAGQGRSIGHRFEHLAGIRKRLPSCPVAVCMDTCHVFAAGYPLAPQSRYRQTLREFDKVLGLDQLKMFHLNDSLKPFGSRVDRHAHIGQGCMGLEPFAYLVRDRRFRNHPMIMETPKGEHNGQPWDAINMQTLQNLLKAD